MEKVYLTEDKIARFRDTKNHAYARAIVDFAVKNGCSIIQLEDLTGIRDTVPGPEEEWDLSYVPAMQRLWLYCEGKPPFCGKSTSDILLYSLRLYNRCGP